MSEALLVGYAGGAITALLARWAWEAARKEWYLRRLAKGARELEASRRRETAKDVESLSASLPRCGSAKAPPGWTCTRRAGHEGPCAAVQTAEGRKTTREMEAITLPPEGTEPHGVTVRRLTPLAWWRNRYGKGPK